MVLKDSKLPTLTIGGILPNSIKAICLAKLDSANTSPLLGPVRKHTRNDSS